MRGGYPHGAPDRGSLSFSHCAVQHTHSCSSDLWVRHTAGRCLLLCRKLPWPLAGFIERTSFFPSGQLARQVLLFVFLSLDYFPAHVTYSKCAHYTCHATTLALPDLTTAVVALNALSATKPCSGGPGRPSSTAPFRSISSTRQAGVKAASAEGDGSSCGT